MAARLRPRASAPGPDRHRGTRLPLRVMAAGEARARRRSLRRELGGTVVAGLDALLVGLVGAFVITAGLNGPAMFLGIPWPLEMLVWQRARWARSSSGPPSGWRRPNLSACSASA